MRQLPRSRLPSWCVKELKTALNTLRTEHLTRSIATSRSQFIASSGDAGDASASHSSRSAWAPERR